MSLFDQSGEQAVGVAEQVVGAHPELSDELQATLTVNRSVSLSNWPFLAVSKVEINSGEELGHMGRKGTEDTVSATEQVSLANRRGTVTWEGARLPQAVKEHFETTPDAYGFAHEGFVYGWPLGHYSDTERSAEPKRRLPGALILAVTGWMEGPIWGLESSHEGNLFRRFKLALNEPDYMELWRREVDVAPKIEQALLTSTEIQAFFRSLEDSVGNVVPRELVKPNWVGLQCCSDSSGWKQFVAIPGSDDFALEIRQSYEHDALDIIVVDLKDQGGSTGDGELCVGKIFCEGRLVETGQR